MAKINLITQEITTSILTTAQILKSQQHDVFLWTDQKNKTVSPSNLTNIFFPFEKWSLGESLAFLSRYALSSSEVFHFFAGQKWHWRQTSLYLGISSLPQHRTLLTITDEFLQEDSASLDFILQTSPTVIFESYLSKQKAHQKSPRKRNQKWMIQSPLFQLQTSQVHILGPANSEDSPTESFDFFFQSTGLSSQLCLISPLKFQSQNLLKLSQSFSMFFLYSDTQEISDFDWKRWHHQIQEMKGLPFTCAPEKKGCASLFRWINSSTQKAKTRVAIFICGETLTTQELTFWMSLSLQYRIPIILDDEQSMTYSTLWKPGQNCLLLPRNDLQKNWTFCLHKIKNMSWDSSQAQELDPATLDNLFNQVSRLYQSTAQSI